MARQMLITSEIGRLINSHRNFSAYLEISDIAMNQLFRGMLKSIRAETTSSLEFRRFLGDGLSIYANFLYSSAGAHLPCCANADGGVTVPSTIIYAEASTHAHRPGRICSRIYPHPTGPLLGYPRGKRRVSDLESIPLTLSRDLITSVPESPLCTIICK
ncbi:hypothetical protein TNCT_514911 [Trichonephila clavata]|uniref:Uncharacterized protein n=1 Tax=Trichonephila clavata TaxID=2740835 RepID=A0A8X6L310_TRICU|nr:hypothetical protein TNCT_514911 [Trichonephila clavata]